MKLRHPSLQRDVVLLTVPCRNRIEGFEDCEEVSGEQDQLVKILEVIGEDAKMM